MTVPHTQTAHLHSHQGTDGQSHWPPQTQQLDRFSRVALSENSWYFLSASYRPGCQARLAALWM